MSKETPEQARARRTADCARVGHSWVASRPNGPRSQCSWCGASNPNPQPSEPGPEALPTRQKPLDMSNEYNQRQRDQAIANNNAAHRRNIESYLQPMVEYAKTENLIGVAKMQSLYMEAESRRMQDKLAVMERYQIEQWPTPHSPHKELASKLLQEVANQCEINAERARQRKAAQPLREPELVQVGLWEANA